MQNHDSLVHIHKLFQKEFQKNRQEMLVFSICSVVFTPLAIAFAFFFVLSLLATVGFGPFDASSLVLELNLFVGALFIAYLVYPNTADHTQQPKWWMALAIALFGLMLVLTYRTPLLQANWQMFWLIYFLLAFGILACLGASHAANSGLPNAGGRSPSDNPFSVKGDIKRKGFLSTKLALFRLLFGSIIALTDLILRSYGVIFGSSWLWQGLSRREQEIAVKVLYQLATCNERQARNLLVSVGKPTGDRVMRVFDQMDLVKLSQGKLWLTTRGEKLLQAQ